MMLTHLLSRHSSASLPSLDLEYKPGQSIEIDMNTSTLRSTGTDSSATQISDHPCSIAFSPQTKPQVLSDAQMTQIAIVGQMSRAVVMS